MKIRITKHIWDDGQDHHPATLLASPGDVLNVLEASSTGYEIARNGRFHVNQDECEVISSSSLTVGDKP